MANAATTPQAKYHYLCSIKACSGEQEYMIYELKITEKPFSETDYQREVLEFCGYDTERIEERMKEITKTGEFNEWPYDDRIYRDPWVQDISESEHDVLSKYLHCR